MNPEDHLSDELPGDKAYDHDYVVFDEFGLLELRCTNCGIQIGGRTYTDMRSRSDLSKVEKVMVFIRHANYAERDVRMSNGSIAKIPHCVDCTEKPMHMVKITRQIKRAWMKENIFAGHSLEQLNDHHSTVKNISAKESTGNTHIPWHLHKGDKDAGR